MSPRDGSEVDNSTVFSLKDLPLFSFSCCYIVEIHRIGNALLYYKKSRQRQSVVTMATRHLRLSTLFAGRLFFFLVIIFASRYSSSFVMAFAINSRHSNDL